MLEIAHNKAAVKAADSPIPMAIQLFNREVFFIAEKTKTVLLPILYCE